MSLYNIFNDNLIMSFVLLKIIISYKYTNYLCNLTMSFTWLRERALAAHHLWFVHGTCVVPSFITGCRCSFVIGSEDMYRNIFSNLDNATFYEVGIDPSSQLNPRGS
jgi:ABC-type antimicrobial peptide transport system permease subunit